MSLACLVIAGGALWLAVPRLASGFAIAPYGDILATLETASPAAAARAERGYRRAARWLQSPQTAADLGALAFAAARRDGLAGDGEAARARLTESAELHRAALTLSPLQPYVWTRLVQTELAAEGPRAPAAAHLGMALDSAPWEPALVVPRLGLAFLMWNDLDADLRVRLDRQIRHAAWLYPMALARVASQRRAQDKVLSAIEDDSELLRRFSLAYSRL